tara:strand:- start:211 stop:855 length:645 start_codon:yes stop_codon:yes gene_type:complete
VIIRQLAEKENDVKCYEDFMTLSKNWKSRNLSESNECILSIMNGHYKLKLLYEWIHGGYNDIMKRLIEHVISKHKDYYKFYNITNDKQKEILDILTRSDYLIKTHDELKYVIIKPNLNIIASRNIVRRTTNDKSNRIEYNVHDVDLFKTICSQHREESELDISWVIFEKTTLQWYIPNVVSNKKACVYAHETYWLKINLVKFKELLTQSNIYPV